ncbi:hypothetical protein BMS3Bbin02_01939 [bacterium BMS3Bbin02]|nr:hypothetical protein BMS3Bbin02_01939 [bacterium BMS3Bbin02]
MRPRNLGFILVFAALGLGACAGPSVIVSGDAVRSPEPAPPQIAFKVVDREQREPIEAQVSFGENVGTADETGAVSLEWDETPTQLIVNAPGFHPDSTLITTFPEDGLYEVELNPVILEGTITTPDGKPLSSAIVSLGSVVDETDSTGRYRLERVTAGELRINRPAWESITTRWNGDDPRIDVTMSPLMIKALRVNAEKTASPAAWKNILALAARSEVNALVLDTRNEDGIIFHKTNVELANEIGAVRDFYDVERALADMDAAGLYKITRIVTFQDNPLAKARPDLAVIDNTTGQPWKNNKGLRWLDPTNRDSWKLALDLAEEACELGFDEIQFDYVRFPSDGNIKTLSFKEPYTEEVRVATITAFLQEAHDLLNPLGCAVAADIFAITLESGWDEGIGQSPAELSNVIDVLSPMIYTYTYGPGWKGFDNPNNYPVEIVSAALDAGIPKLEGTSIYRPWIQTWQLNAGEIVAVQNVAEKRDLGWMIWSANSIYDDSFLLP